MSSLIIVSAFVWFLFLSPVSDPSVQPYSPPVDVVKAEPQQDFRSSRNTKKKLKSFIRTQNPSISKKDVDEIAFWIDEYATQEDIDPMLVAALIDRESSFKKKAVSKTGAKGLGQIKDFNFKSLNIKDPYNIKQNIRGTVKYLKELKDVWKESNDSTRLVLASYYQGPNATKKKKDNIPSQVTDYVDDILNRYKMLTKK